MKKRKSAKAGDPTTEEKIKNAARTVFLRKGFAATRTRDIAEEAGMNLALLNYYFRSKEKLFELIMMESFGRLVETLMIEMNDEQTSFKTKIERIVVNYIVLLKEEPEIPGFVLSELRNNPAEFVSRMALKEKLMNSYFMKQFREQIETGKMTPVHPLHFIMNLIGMTLFPFIGRPILSNLGGLDKEGFNALIEERKTLIPKWIETIFEIK